MQASGNCGRGGRDYTGAERVLAGRLASDRDTPVYPDDSCVECLKEGKLNADEKCFHRHWAEPTDTPRIMRSKTTSNTEAV